MTYVIERKEIARINNLIISRQRLRNDVGTYKLPAETIGQKSTASTKPKKSR
jgi:hypothetical protein